ncbi:hypothetical protein GCM10008995_29240 [Halobellus salinus]|uniref:Uncharacterized protein n=1 Tax=Halobellus salinus TaxID=931585 RepID=A0A830ESJ8_9EURY|nr:hypothetical protein [Halobellus salinus]GGJ17597.1 hypothetical protein GCM10008995_29240 [Halobellus salinus]SMP35387.1 hypothetical protein SAMN06265347_1308 [Halobellus salinus]
MTPDADTATVRERIEEALGQDRIHGLTVTRRDDETVYCVVVQSTTADRVDGAPDYEFPVLDARTVVVDFSDDTVTVGDNGLWVPQDQDVAESLTQMFGRATSDLGGGTDPDAGPALKSAVEGVDVGLLLERETELPTTQDGQHVDRMESHGGIDPSRPWGYGAGPPPEVDDVVARLEEADLSAEEHLTRLVWGKKEPMDRVPRPVDELAGNYGIELLPRDYGLVALDVDYPGEFPEEFDLPETLEVSSPHGDDSRRHIILKCSQKGKIKEEIGAWAVQSVEWGDLWIGDRYVVGPGSQLSEFGCDDGDHTRGDRGGCDACTDEEGGFYRVVNDAPIATVDAETIVELLEVSDGYTLRERAPEAPDVDDEADVDEGDGGLPTCDNCGASYTEEEAPELLKELSVGGSTRRICRGGCDA